VLAAQPHVRTSTAGGNISDHSARDTRTGQRAGRSAGRREMLNTDHSDTPLLVRAPIGRTRTVSGRDSMSSHRRDPGTCEPSRILLMGATGQMSLGRRSFQDHNRVRFHPRPWTGQTALGVVTGHDQTVGRRTPASGIDHFRVCGQPSPALQQTMIVNARSAGKGSGSPRMQTPANQRPPLGKPPPTRAATI